MTFIALLKKTSAYKKYAKGEKNLIIRSEILEALRIPSSSQSLTETHLAKYLEYANRVNEYSVLEFLEFARTKLGGDTSA